MNFFKIVLLIGTLVGVLQSKACDPKVKSKQELALDMALKDSAELFAGEGLPTIAEVPTQKVERIGTVEEIGKQLVVDVEQIATKAVTSSKEVVELTKDITSDKKLVTTLKSYIKAYDKLQQLDKELEISLKILNEAEELNDDYTLKYGEEIVREAGAKYDSVLASHKSAQEAFRVAKIIRNETQKKEAREREERIAKAKYQKLNRDHYRRN